MIVIDENGLRSLRPFAAQSPRRCVFEWVYFSRPDSTIDGISVYRARENMGHRLALEHPVDADVVIPVPDSGHRRRHRVRPGERHPVRPGADALALRRPDVHRAVAVDPALRGEAEAVAGARGAGGKRVVVVDDSIVRGTTSRKIIQMIRSAGAREIHMRISSPPTVGPVPLRHRHPVARRADRLVAVGGRDPQVRRAPTRSATCRSRGCTPPSARARHVRRARTTACATPASPTSTRSP